MSGQSPTPTPYAVRCRNHGLIYLTPEEYTRQLEAANDIWRCPTCRAPAHWDDDVYEEAMEYEQAMYIINEFVHGPGPTEVPRHV